MPEAGTGTSTGDRTQDTGHRTQDTGHRTQDTGGHVNTLKSREQCEKCRTSLT